MLIALTAAALAGHFDDVGAKRSVKVDLYSFGQAVHPYGSDWTPSMLDAWSGVLHCEVVKTRLEVCTFENEKLFFGILPQGEEYVKYQEISMKGEIELAWTPTGRLSRFDVRGDRTAFWEQAANAQLQLFHRDVVFKPDSVRRIGDDLEKALVRMLVSAMEVDLSKKGNPTWRTNKPLWAGRRYSGGVTATARYDWHTMPAEADLTPIGWTGTVSEATTSGSTGGFSTKTRVAGKAWLEPTKMRVERLHVESATMSTSVALVGHTRWIATSRPWKEGDSTEPLPMPAPQLE